MLLLGLRLAVLVVVVVVVMGLLRRRLLRVGSKPALGKRLVLRGRR